MIPKPITRDQARQNAIMAAENAHFAAEEQEAGSEHALSWAQVSRAWSDITQTFPYDEPDTYEVQENDSNTRPVMLTSSERETIERLREGSLVTVHPDYVVEHQGLIRSQFRTEPGYVGMAVTLEEQRTLMAMRSGNPREATTQTLPVVSPERGQVKVDRDFYLILMAIAVATCNDQAENGVVLIHPEDIEATYTKNVMVVRADTFPSENAPWKIWLEERDA